METAEMVRGIVEHVKPSAVIAIDALAAMETARICTTVQITDTGISPGSGVGNHRLGLTESTLGVPVIAIGVPMVVYAATIAKDALSILMHDIQMPSSDHMDAVDALTDKISAHSLGEMVVTPREVDELVGNLAEVLSLGINMALQPKLSGDEIPILMH
jgi:spore protease